MYATGTIQGSMNAISANSKYKAEALKVLELMNTDSKFRDMCAYGTEGNYMKYSEDGTVQKLRDDWNWPSYTQGTFFILSTQTDGDPDAGNRLRNRMKPLFPLPALDLHWISRISRMKLQTAIWYGINTKMIC